jgi:hypothetical protein
MPDNQLEINKTFNTLNSKDTSSNLTPDDKARKQVLKQQKNKHTLAVETYKKLFWAICIYIVLVLLLLIGNKNYFQLDYSVLITLLSTTTANILGVFYIASKWLYETDR